MEYTVLLLFVLLSCVVDLSWCNVYNKKSYYYDNDLHQYCSDLSPHYGDRNGDIDLDQITGVWYGVEKIPHAKGEYKIEHTQECFYVDIKEKYIEPTEPSAYPPPLNTPYLNHNYGYPEQHHRTRHFVLEWHEGLWQDDYHVKVNTTHKGFWVTDLPNRSVENMYRHFGGLIQVLKVANNYLVLNFCLRLPHSQLYSVVLSRHENQLTAEDLAGIHNIFTIKHLSTSALKRVCENAATSLVFPGLLLFALIFILRHFQ